MLHLRWLVLLLCAVLALPGRTQPVLRIGWDDYPPYQMASEGERQGIDMDIIRLALRQAGYAADFVRLPWSRQLLLARTGELDIVMSASPSPERNAYAQWSRAYRPEKVALLALPGRREPVGALRELIGRPVRIGLIRDSFYGGEYESLRTRADFQALLEFTPANEVNLRKLYAGRIHYLIDDPVTMAYRVRAGGGAPLRGVLVLADAPVHFLISRRTVARHPALPGRLDKALARMQRRGQIGAIFSLYGTPLPH